MFLSSVRYLGVRREWSAMAKEGRQIGTMRVAFLIACALAVQTTWVSARRNFVTIHLPHGIRVDLPRNWVALSANARVTLDAAVEARKGKPGHLDFASDLLDGVS